MRVNARVRLHGRLWNFQLLRRSLLSVKSALRLGVVAGFIIALLVMKMSCADSGPTVAESKPVSAPPSPVIPEREGSTAEATKTGALQAALDKERAANKAALETIQKLEAEKNEANRPTILAHTPIPFPANPPENFTPAKFRAVAEEALKSCDAGVSLRDVDCSEYPCIAWTRLRPQDGGDATVDMSDCAPWTKAYGEDTLVFNVGSAAVLVPLPPEDLKRVLGRAKERTAQHLRDLDSQFGNEP